MANLDASAQALEAGTVDMALVRSDVLTSASGQTIAILRRDMVGIIVQATSSIIETVGQLAAKTIGLVSEPIGNEHLLDQILTYYQIPVHTVRRVALAPNEIVRPCARNVSRRCLRWVQRVPVPSPTQSLL